MARNKYVKDYRIVEHINERGRIKSDYEYIGDYYRFVDGASAEKAEKTVLALDALSLVLFVAALLLRSRASLRLYVILPFIFSAVPMFTLADLVISVMRAPKPLEHRFADRLDNSYPVNCLAAAVLAGVSVIAEAISVIVSREGLMAGDAVFTVCAVCMTAAMFKAFSARKSFNTEKIEQTEQTEKTEKTE